MLLNTVRSLVVAAAGLLSAALPPIAIAERPDMPLHVLHCADYQLEVTVLSIEVKKGPHNGDSIWHRVRVDRVMHGSKLQVGDETAVVSMRYINPPGTTGTAGDRGLPAAKGDRMRIFASGNSDGSILSSLPPNGWQPAEPGVVVLDGEGETPSAKLLAEHLLSSGNVRLLENRRVEYETDAAVVCLQTLLDAKPSTAMNEKADAGKAWMMFSGKLPLVVLPLQEGELRVVPQAPLEKPEETKGSKPAQVSEALQVLGATLTLPEAASMRVLMVSEDAAKHHILQAAHIPAEGTALVTARPHASKLASDCKVLLWGQAHDKTGANVGERAPLLWTREIPRSTNRWRVVDGERKASEEQLPSNRMVVSLLSQADLDRLGISSSQMMQWALRRE